MKVKQHLLVLLYLPSLPDMSR